MTYVVSVRFKSHGKFYFFDPNGIEVQNGDMVVVETSKGLELGECVVGNHAVEENSIVQPLRPVIRAATADDLRVAEINKSREKEAFEICQKKIVEHGLDMKLVDVECNFEGNKILFFFTSDGRVDFRELVKDLASIFRTRIELRQIGVRDEAKMLGGLGICGRPFCCSQFLNEFQPVSTKMAKTQSRSLNPTKISGSCGRLMCCLRYEQEAYEDLVKSVPKNGAFVQTEAGYGNVVQVNLLRRKIKVKIDGDGDQMVKSYDADEVAVIPGGRPKPGEPLPSLLQPKEKKVPEKPEPEEECWEIPELIAGSMERTKSSHPAQAESEESEGKKKPPRRRPPHSKGGRGPQQGGGERRTQQPSGGRDSGGKKPYRKPLGERPQRSAEGTEHSGSAQKRRTKRPYPARSANEDAVPTGKRNDPPSDREHGTHSGKNRRRYHSGPRDNGGKPSDGAAE